MRTRDAKGGYTPHLSPGDGTGFSNVPVKDAQTHQRESDRADDAGNVKAIHYAARERPVKRG